MLGPVPLQERIADTWRFTVDPPVGQRLALFLPFADIWTHQRVIEHFAHTWSKDNEIRLIKCDGLRHGACPAHRALKLDDSTPLSERRRICERCKSVSGLSSQVPTIDLATFETPPVALPTTLTELLDFTLRGHPFGRLAIYNYLLTAKKSSEELSQEDLYPLSSAIQDAVSIYNKLVSIFERTEFDTLVIDNQLYGFNASAVAAAKDFRLDVLNLNLGMFRSNHDRSIFLTHDADDYFFLGEPYSENTNSRPVISAAFSRVLRREMRSRYLRRHSLNYGGNESRWKRTRTIVPKYTGTLFLSSPDEMQTYHFARGTPAPDLDQLKLLDNFITLAQQHPSKTFCIRPHPRLKSNQRDLNQSPFHEILSKHLQELPSNIDVDGAEVTRTAIQALRSSKSVVVAWSTIGLDAAALGLPVVFGLPGFPISYPKEVGIPVRDTSYEAFEEAFEVALDPLQNSNGIKAVCFYRFLWDAHVRLTISPIKFSPAMVLLWLQRRTSRAIHPSFHRVTRILEFKFNTSILPFLLFLPSLLRSCRTLRPRGLNPRTNFNDDVSEEEIILDLQRALGIRR